MFLARKLHSHAVALSTTRFTSLTGVATQQLSRTLISSRCFQSRSYSTDSEDELVIYLAEKIREGLSEYKRNCWKPIVTNLPEPTDFFNSDTHFLQHHSELHSKPSSRFGGFPSLLKGEHWPYYNFEIKQTDGKEALANGTIGPRKYSPKPQVRAATVGHSIPLHFLFQINLNDVPQEAKELFSPLFPFVDDFLIDEEMELLRQGKPSTKQQPKAGKKPSETTKTKWKSFEQRRREDIARKKFADAGLLQVFTCLSGYTADFIGKPFNKGTLIRIIPTRDIDASLSNPAFTDFPVQYSVNRFTGFASFEDVLATIPKPTSTIGYTPLPCKAVSGWELFQSYPGLFEERHIDAKILTLMLQHEDETEEMKQFRRMVPEHVKELVVNHYLQTYNRLGDTLGGWPQWFKATDYPDCNVDSCDNFLGNVVFNLNSPTSSEDGESAEGLLPVVWGEQASARVLQCPRHRTTLSFSFEDVELPEQLNDTIADHEDNEPRTHQPTNPPKQVRPKLAKNKTKKPSKAK